MRILTKCDSSQHLNNIVYIWEYEWFDEVVVIRSFECAKNSFDNTLKC